ncbi:hypothetical protein JOM56_002639 [Amanita muscaria]
MAEQQTSNESKGDDTSSNTCSYFIVRREAPLRDGPTLDEAEDAEAVGVMLDVIEVLKTEVMMLEDIDKTGITMETGKGETIEEGTINELAEQGFTWAKDVVDIYRIRHELHGSDITVVSFEEATTKVKAFISNEGRKDDAETGTAEQRDADVDDDQASVWTDVGSVSSSRSPSTENDRKPEAAVSMAETSLPLSEAVTTVGAERLGGPVSQHRSPNASSTSDAPDSQGGDTQLTFEDIPNMRGSTSRGLMEISLDVLTMKNFDVVSVKFLQWVNANDNQIIYHVARLIFEKAVKNHWQTDICIHLCKEIVKKCTVIAGDRLFLFREHLGEACQKELVDVTVSITATLARSGETSPDSLPRATRRPKVRRLRLIRFIRELSSEVITSRAIVEKLIAPLLDAKDAEKLVTLSMLLDSAGLRWDASTGELKAFMNSCFVEMANIAQKTDNARLRTLLQDVIRHRNRGCVANETAQQRRGLTEKRRPSCTSEDELANEQSEVETVKTSKGGGKTSGERDMMLASSDEEPLDDERHWFVGNRLGSLEPVTKGSLGLDY